MDTGHLQTQDKNCERLEPLTFNAWWAVVSRLWIRKLSLPKQPGASAKQAPHTTKNAEAFWNKSHAIRMQNRAAAKIVFKSYGHTKNKPLLAFENGIGLGNGPHLGSSKCFNFQNYSWEMNYLLVWYCTFETSLFQNQIRIKNSSSLFSGTGVWQSSRCLTAVTPDSKRQTTPRQDSQKTKNSINEVQPLCLVLVSD